MFDCSLYLLFAWSFAATVIYLGQLQLERFLGWCRGQVELFKSSLTKDARPIFSTGCLYSFGIKSIPYPLLVNCYLSMFPKKSLFYLVHVQLRLSLLAASSALGASCSA